MKARCLRLIDAFGKPQDKSQWLTIGKTYHVLELFQGRDGWCLRLMGDEPNGLAIFRLNEFEVVSPKIPSSWIVAWGKDGSLHLRPERWGDPGFWERYYDQDPEAIRVFEEERRKIVEAEPKLFLTGRTAGLRPKILGGRGAIAIVDAEANA